MLPWWCDKDQWNAKRSVFRGEQIATLVGEDKRALLLEVWSERSYISQQDRSEFITEGCSWPKNQTDRKFKDCYLFPQERKGGNSLKYTIEKSFRVHVRDKNKPQTRAQARKIPSMVWVELLSMSYKTYLYKCSYGFLKYLAWRGLRDWKPSVWIPLTKMSVELTKSGAVILEPLDTCFILLELRKLSFVGKLGPLEGG